MEHNQFINLNQFRFNYSSQNGEDGIIEYLCEKLGIEKGWCVEFGAWDGEHLSNTNHLFTKKGWSTILIESSDERFNLLRENYKDKDNIYTLKARVGFKADDPFRLDELLRQTPVPINFDLLSIDVDGNDWHIWESLMGFHPRMVIIEANSSFNYDEYYLGDPDSGTGASVRTITELGKAKGYELVAHTGNCIFIKKKDYHLVGLKDNSLKFLFDDQWYKKAKKERRITTKIKRKITSSLIRIKNFIIRILIK